MTVHVDSKIMEGDEIKHEQMRSILELSSDFYGVCTDFRYEEYIRNAEAIAMLKSRG